MQTVVRTAAPSLQGNCPRARYSTSWAPGEEIKGQDHRESCQCGGRRGEAETPFFGDLAVPVPPARGSQCSEMSPEGSAGALSFGQATASLVHIGQRATIMAAPCVCQP